MVLYLEILMFSDFVAKYSASEFTILFELSLKAIVLDVELTSVSNDTIFDQGYREKISIRVTARDHRMVNAIVRMESFCSMPLIKNSIIRHRN